MWQPTQPHTSKKKRMKERKFHFEGGRGRGVVYLVSFGEGLFNEKVVVIWQPVRTGFNAFPAGPVAASFNPFRRWGNQTPAMSPKLIPLVWERMCEHSQAWPKEAAHSDPHLKILK